MGHGKTQSGVDTWARSTKGLLSQVRLSPLSRFFLLAGSVVFFRDRACNEAGSGESERFRSPPGIPAGKDVSVATATDLVRCITNAWQSPKQTLCLLRETMLLLFEPRRFGAAEYAGICFSHVKQR